MIAGLENNINIVKYLESYGAKLNEKNNQGENLLMIISKYSNNDRYYELIQYLIEKKIKLHEKNNKGENALSLCLKEIPAEFYDENGNLIKYENKIGNLRTIKLFLSLNMDMFCVDKMLFNAIQYACIKSKNILNVTLLILEKCNDMNKLKDIDGNNLILEKCNDISKIKDIDGNNLSLTPLMIACLNRDVETIKLLLSLGANIDEVNDEGNNALMITIKNSYNDSYLSIVELLMENES